MLRAAMVNTRPIGLPHSIILENLFARTFDASKLDEDTATAVQCAWEAYMDRGFYMADRRSTTKVRATPAG